MIGESALNQRAVLWARTGYRSDGRTLVSITPIEIKVRWEDVESEVLDEDNNPIAQPIQVMVDRQITVGSQLWKGKLTDLPNNPSPLFEVVTYDSTPTLSDPSDCQRNVTLLKK